jgi:iron(III) transport system substrate-binding protein
VTELARWLVVATLASAASVAFAQEVNVVCGVPITWCETLGTLFQNETGIRVNMTMRDANDALAHLAADKSAPRHDVWYAGDGTSHAQAAAAALTDAYRSPRLADLREFAVRQAEQTDGHSVGIHAAVLGIAYNARTLARKRLPTPSCWADLARSDYRDELQIANPVSSSTAYLMLASLVQIFGEERAFELLRGMHANVKAYQRTGNGPVRALARGETAVAVTMLHDAAVEVGNGFPVTMVVPCEGAGYQVEAMSVVRGAPHAAEAKRFYDWALAPAAQKIASDLGHFELPANRSVTVPPTAPYCTSVTLVPLDARRFDAAGERKRLLEKWAHDVLAQPR